jgi:hypothetical protein
MLSILSGDPQDYKSWAESYYERSINIEAVRLIYEHKPLTDELLHRLNPDRDLDSLAADVKEIGYPA